MKIAVVFIQTQLAPAIRVFLQIAQEFTKTLLPVDVAVQIPNIIILPNAAPELVERLSLFIEVALGGNIVRWK